MECGGCGSKKLMGLFSLGKVPPVNDFLLVSEIPREKGYALDLYFCQDCSLVQLGDRVPPTNLFSHYLHLSGASKANVAHLEEVAAIIRSRFGGSLQGRSVLEIGSNDGTLLELMKKSGASVLGVDPARNLAERVRERGMSVIADFFCEEIGRSIAMQRGAQDVVVALNVVAHTPDFVSLLRGVREALAPDGTFMMENAYVVDTILKGQFDTIYHEHVYCFSASALKYAFDAAGLQIIDVEIIPTQGTSIRVFGCRKEHKATVSSRVRQLLDQEVAKGFTDVDSYLPVPAKVAAFREELRRRIYELKSRTGSKVIALGAPARGVVILNYCGLTENDIELVIDDTPLKQGRLVPGMHIPVKGWDALSGKRKEARAYLLLSWNYKKDMLSKLRGLVKSGTVLVPFPDMTEVTVEES